MIKSLERAEIIVEKLDSSLIMRKCSICNNIIEGCNICGKIEEIELYHCNCGCKSHYCFDCAKRLARIGRSSDG